MKTGTGTATDPRTPWGAARSGGAVAGGRSTFVGGSAQARGHYEEGERGRERGCGHDGAAAHRLEPPQRARPQRRLAVVVEPRMR